MKIAIVGTGYVGLVTGACFAEMGADVTCVDIDEKKISALKNAEIPFYEPGLDDLVGRNCAAGRLSFTTRLQDVINEVDAVFAAVGTPPKDDGAADLSYVYSLAEQVGRLHSIRYQEYRPCRNFRQGKSYYKQRVGQTWSGSGFRHGIESGVPQRGQCGKGFHESRPRHCRHRERKSEGSHDKALQAFFTE